MTERETLIFRLEQAYRLGRGYQMTHDELGLLHTKEIEIEEPGKPEAPEKLERIDVEIRWLIRRDLEEILNFSETWTENDYLEHLRKRNCIGMVCVFNHKVVGFMVYYLEKDMLDLRMMEVHPEYRRREIGRQMIDRLIDKISDQRRERITLMVRETNIVAQKFFADCGFKVVDIERDFYLDVEEDGYRMEYRIRNKAIKET